MQLFARSSLLTLTAVYFLSVFVPFLCLANTPTTPSTDSKSDALSYNLFNPLGNRSIQDLLIIILNMIIMLLTPLVVIFIILAGFKYVTARGNPQQIKEATQALTWAIIGGVIIIGAVSIARIIQNFISSF